MTESELIIALLSVAVPYVTATIRWVWRRYVSAMPRWLGPLQAYVAGIIVTIAGKMFGVELPTDLANVTDSQVQAILLDGAVVSSVGSMLRNFVHGVRKEARPDSKTGKAIKLIAGKDKQQ